MGQLSKFKQINSLQAILLKSNYNIYKFINLRIVLIRIHYKIKIGHVSL